MDYDDQSAFVNALKGHDALVITLAVNAPQDLQQRIIHAAADAGVPWIVPNEWGPDTSNEAMAKDMFTADRVVPIRQLISQLGKSSYVVVSTGFWYEWSLSFPNAFGFDFDKKTVVLFDEGEARMNVSSFPQVGRAVARLLSLKVKPDGPNDKEPCLEQFKNGWVYPTSFCVNQNDILASVLRVTKTAPADWTITKEPTKQRYEAAVRDLRNGDMSAFTRVLYTRGFFPEEEANIERWKGGNHNGMLGLQEEDIDEYTKAGIERVAEMAAWLKNAHRKLDIKAS